MRNLILTAFILSGVLHADLVNRKGGGGVNCASGTNGQVYTTNGSSCSFTTVGGTGTVTSVGLLTDSTTSSIFNNASNKFTSTSTNPVTGAGNFTVSLQNQAANAFLSGPTTGVAATPAFRAIVAADIPTLNQNTSGTAANITSSSNSTLTTLSALSLPGSQVTGNISGSAANITASSNSSLTSLPSLSISGTQVTGNIAGTASNVTGTVAVANGGTNSTTTLNNNRFIVSSAGAIKEASAVTASVIVATDSNGLPTSSSVTNIALLDSLIRSWDGFIESATAKIYKVVAYAPSPGTINKAWFETVSGTLTAAVKINGTNVTGLSAVSVSSTGASTTASGANTFVAGNQITVVVSSPSTPVDFAFSINYTVN